MKVFGIRIGSQFHAIKPSNQKASLTWKVTRLLYSGQDAIWMPKNYANFARQGYQACVDVYACVDWIARAISGIPLVLYTKPKSKKEKRKEIESHPILDLLRRPNPGQGGTRLIDQLLRYFLISGNGYLEGVMVGGQPRELYALRPDRMTVLVGDVAHQVAGYRYAVGSTKQDFIGGEVLHLKTFHPTDDFYGLSPIEVGAVQIDMSNAGSKANAKLLQNDLRPSGMFMFERELTNEQKLEFNEAVKDKFLDVSNRGLPLVVDGKTDYKQLSVTAKDADFIELDRTITRKICRVYNLPPELIGDAQNKTYSNYQEARLAGYEDCALPIAFWLRDELNNWLLRMYEAKKVDGEMGSQPVMELDWDLDKVEALSAKKLDAYNRMAGAWWTTINEKRVACGYDEKKGGNVAMIPMGVSEVDLEEEPSDEPPADDVPPDTIPEDDADGDNAAKAKRFSLARKALKGYWAQPEKKKTLWYAFEHRVKKREKSFESIAKTYLQAQADSISSKMANVTDLADVNPKALLDVEQATSKYGKDFNGWYTDHFIRAGNAGVHAVKGLIFDDEEFKATAKPTSWTFTMTKEQAAKLKRMVFESGTEINKTTLQKIYTELLKAQTANSTIQEFTQAIIDKVKDMSIWRARTWARTESSKVDNFGQLEGYKQTEFVDRKGWMSAFADDSRQGHMDADNGVTIPLNEDFEIEGEQMAYPGDPRGSAGNVVNCMCSIYPEVGE